MSIRMARTVLAMLTSLLVACGGSVSNIDASDSAALQNSGAASDQSNYRIGPGDVLEIFVWRNPEISTSVPVRPDGKISTPLVEDMQAVGRTPSELARQIEEVLAEYIRSPTVNVIVKNFVGTFEGQVRVVGQAAEPKSIPYREGLTLLDVMIEVGGLTEFASGNKAKLVRSEGGLRNEFRVRLVNLLDKGDLSQNLAMKPGDVLIIPESFF
jgi:polysaccharide export outer membrane protein